jgi:hypothetical protein
MEETTAIGASESNVSTLIDATNLLENFLMMIALCSFRFSIRHGIVSFLWSCLQVVTLPCFNIMQEGEKENVLGQGKAGMRSKSQRDIPTYMDVIHQ